MDNELIYIDTNVYIDYLENRTDGLRPLGEFAHNLLRRAVECEYKIAISSLVVDELDFNNYGEKIREIIAKFRLLGKMLYIEESEKDEEDALRIKKRRNTPLNDTKHAVIAHRAKAIFFVTRNIRDYTELQDLVRLRCPENL